MLLKLIYESAWGGRMSLTDNPYFWLTDVEGLTKGEAELSANTVGGSDGDVVTNRRTLPRDIRCYLRIKNGVKVEEAKRHVMSYVKLKQNCKVYWEQAGRRWVISGIVQSADMPRFNNEVTMYIAIHCENPYWTDTEETVEELDNAIGLHYFTDNESDMLYFIDEGVVMGVIDFTRRREYFNSGDVDVGMVIEILAYGSVTNPVIQNGEGDFFGLGTPTKPFIMQAGDKVVINTNVGEKSATLNGQSILDYVKPLSSWLQFKAGENIFYLSSDDVADDNMAYSVTFKQRYI